MQGELRYLPEYTYLHVPATYSAPATACRPCNYRKTNEIQQKLAIEVI